MSNDIQIASNVIEFHKKDNGEIETGPNYSVRLPDSFPLNAGGMRQAAPRRTELVRCNEKFPRVAAAYEMAVAHLQVAVAHLNRAKSEQIRLADTLVAALKDLHQKLCEEMKTEMEWENEPAWEGILEGVSKSSLLVQQILARSMEQQPVEVASTGEKEGEQ